MTNEIQGDLAGFIRSRAAMEEDLTPDTDLLDAGALDSLLIMDLLAHVESTYGVHLEPGEITPQNFRSITRLTQLIVRKRG